MTIDIIVCWPRNCDYPLWREFIRKNRTRFNLVIIVFTETNCGSDYRNFVREAMLRDYVLFVDNPPIKGDEDWRNVGIHQALIHSYNAEWIWFTEQDFIIKDGFWEYLEAAAETKNHADVVATYDHGRMHPCNIFIKRKTLYEKTRRNFGIVKDVSDHFSLIQKNLEESDAIIEIFHPDLYEHLNGLSHNFRLIEEGQIANWQPERFRQYIEDSLKVTVPIDPGYKRLVEQYLDKTKV